MLRVQAFPPVPVSVTLAASSTSPLPAPSPSIRPCKYAPCKRLRRPENAYVPISCFKYLPVEGGKGLHELVDPPTYNVQVFGCDYNQGGVPGVTEKKLQVPLIHHLTRPPLPVLFNPSDSADSTAAVKAWSGPTVLVPASKFT